VEATLNTSRAGGTTSDPSRLQLRNGARVAVIGGGPSGSFFSYFLLQMAERVGLELEVDLYEPRDFSCPGPRSCNMCGGIVSESLMQNLAAEGIQLPPGIVQRRIDSYFLHMDVGSVRIETPLQEMRIAAVARGAGPRGSDHALESFDGFLLDLAERRGVRRVSERVTDVDVAGELPRIRTSAGADEGYDLVASAIGVNAPLLRTFEKLEGYRPPRRSKAYIAEFHLGSAMIERYLANAMHVFLLNLPRLDFAALIPKNDFVTVCLLGREIDKALVDAFLSSDEVRQVLPPHWQIPKDFCHCSPHLNVETAFQPYRDRVVFVGDCGTTRLFKDGIGAAYRTAKAAARTAVFQGIGEADFRRGYWPTCKAIHSDNRLGKVVFAITREIQKRRFARRGLWRMTSREQRLEGDKRRMSKVLWDTFTGSAPYRSVIRRSVHPAFLGRLFLEVGGALRSNESHRPKHDVVMASGRTGEVGRQYRAGDVIYREGDRGHRMSIICGGRVEVFRQEGDRIHALPTLGDGDFFGEMALFGEEVRPDTVRALEDVGIVSLKREDLVQRVHEDPSMAYRLIERMASRIAGLEGSLVHCTELPGEPWELARRERSAPTHAAGDGARDTRQAGPMGRAYRAGEVVYRQGDPGDCMYLIRGGKVESVFRRGADEFHLPVLGDDDFFGELALFGAEVRPATVRALTEVHIYTIERNSLLRQIHEDPSMAFQLVESMANRIARLEESLIRYGIERPAATLPG
jgi:CRP-like cAMP-binding protein/flavin-dependent dehydrogenase